MENEGFGVFNNSSLKIENPLSPTIITRYRHWLYKEGYGN